MRRASSPDRLLSWRRHTSRIAVLLLAASSLSGAAFAQTARPSADSNVDASRSDDIVVKGAREEGYSSRTQSGGTFGETSTLDVPFSVTVIPQALLIDQQVRSLGDIVRNDPSTLVSTPPGFNDTINVRGYNLDNSSSYRREGLIFQNQVQSPFENKAAVEIVKGPTSVRYGFTPAWWRDQLCAETPDGGTLSVRAGVRR